jgi:hypothetical protein
MTKLGYQPKILLPEGEFFRFEILSASIEGGEYGYQLSLELKTLGGKHSGYIFKAGRRSAATRTMASLSKRAARPKSLLKRSSAPMPTSRTSPRTHSRAGASWLALPSHRAASVTASSSALSGAFLLRIPPSSN